MGINNNHIKVLWQRRITWGKALVREHKKCWVSVKNCNYYVSLNTRVFLDFSRSLWTAVRCTQYTGHLPFQKANPEGQVTCVFVRALYHSLHNLNLVQIWASTSQCWLVCDTFTLIETFLRLSYFWRERELMGVGEEGLPSRQEGRHCCTSS